MVWHCQRAESRAQRRLAGDRRGCWCHYESDDCDRRRFLRVSCGGGTLRAASSIRCVHREESHSGPQKRREHGRIHRNFRGDVLPDARSSRAHPRRAIRAVGRYSLAPTYPPGPLRAPRERPFSWSLHACSTRLFAIRRRSSHSGKRCGASSCGGALRRARVGFRCTCSKNGTAALWLRASPAVRTSREMAFSLGMIADYMDSLITYGAAFYRNLFWEAGLVGQVLYLEAEEASIRSTGIGCYFDDPVHEVFGISSHDWQSFYHFTVGGPVEDKRLTTLPAYKLEDER